MINRPRTALVSVTAVAVSMMVLGSNARAQSVPTASPQNYLRFLQRVARSNETGISLMQRYSSLERTMNILKHIPHPGPRIVRQIATRLQSGDECLFQHPEQHQRPSGEQAVLQGQYQALQLRRRRCSRGPGLSGSKGRDAAGSGLQPTEQCTGTCRG